MNTTKQTDLAAALRDLIAPIIREAILDAFAELEPEQQPALLDRTGLARELNVCTSTVGRLMKLGMPRVMVLDSQRFEIAPVLEWLRNRTQEGLQP